MEQPFFIGYGACPNVVLRKLRTGPRASSTKGFPFEEFFVFSVVQFLSSSFSEHSGALAVDAFSDNAKLFSSTFASWLLFPPCKIRFQLKLKRKKRIHAKSKFKRSKHIAFIQKRKCSCDPSKIIIVWDAAYIRKALC